MSKLLKLLKGGSNVEEPNNVFRVERYNGDDGVDYLVNDGRFDLDLLKEKQLILFGERHYEPEDYEFVKELIKELKPKFVLHEALGDYYLPDYSSKKSINRKKLKDHYYQGLTKLWLGISLESDSIFVGMEKVDWKKGEYEKLSMMETFRLRELHWIEIIEKYKAKLGRGECMIAIGGDTHFRTIPTLTLGGVSPLYLRYNNKKDSIVIRSRMGEIE